MLNVIMLSVIMLLWVYSTEEGPYYTNLKNDRDKTSDSDEGKNCNKTMTISVYVIKLFWSVTDGLYK